jgi:ribosomal-protein-alanine N-acetyltransferase
LALGAFDGGGAGDRLVGMIRIRKEWPNHPMRAHAATFGMMLLKEVWGQGLGQRLLQAQDEHARAVGITRLEAGVRAENERAVALYKRAGFKIEGTLEKYARVDGTYVHEYAIVKFYGDAAPEPFVLPTLVTPRLVLRPLTLGDAAAIFAYASDAEVARFTLWDPHQSVADARAYLQDYVFPRYAERELDGFGITLAGGLDTVIGTLGCFRAGNGGRTLELAYALARPFWGRGLVVEAARAVTGHAFATLPAVQRIQAHCKAENTGSARVMEKLGMRYEGTARAAVFNRGRFWDAKMYALLRGEPDRSSAEAPREGGP